MTSFGDFDVYISKLNSVGDFISAKKIGGIGSDIGSYILINSLDNIYITGGFYNIVDFDPNEGTYELTSNGAEDLFLVNFFEIPFLSEVTPIEPSSTDQTPTYTFSTDEAGTITYGGGCASATTTATEGNNTITFNELEPGTYSNCTITVTDSSLNVSDILSISSFTIERRSSTGSYIGGFRGITNTNVPITSNTIIPTTTLDTQTPTITTNTNNKYISPVDNKELSCKPFNFYLRKNIKNNNINEVKLWQAFLNKYENETLKIDGIYGSKTEQAINNFQLKYKENILTPWNITTPTGYVYKSTRAHGNKLLGCSEGEIVLDNGIKVNF